MPWNLIWLVLLCGLLGSAPALAAVEEAITVERLPGETDAVYADRLFIQCGSWFPRYESVKEASQAKLIEWGLPALELLLPTRLASDNVRHRVTMEAIIAGIGTPAVPLLIASLDDPNPVMRQRILAALGRLDDPAVLPALAERLTEETDVLAQVALLEAVGLRATGEDSLIAPLAPFTVAEDERLRRNAVVALGRIGDFRALQHLIARFDDPQFGVRFPAFEQAIGLLLAGGVGHEVILPAFETAPGKALALEFKIIQRAYTIPAEAWLARIDSELNRAVQGGVIPSQIPVLRALERLHRSEHPLATHGWALVPAQFDDLRIEAVRRELSPLLEAP